MFVRQQALPNVDAGKQLHTQAHHVVYLGSAHNSVPSTLLSGKSFVVAAGAIYHLKYKPPPPEVVDRLVQRSDDTEEKVRETALDVV